MTILLALLAALSSPPADPARPPPAAAHRHPSFNVQVSGKGPAMIFIPGLACSGEVWDGAVAQARAMRQMFEQLSDEQYAAQSRQSAAAGTARHFVMLDDPGTLFAEMDSFLGER